MFKIEIYSHHLCQVTAEADLSMMWPSRNYTFLMPVLSLLLAVLHFA